MLHADDLTPGEVIELGNVSITADEIIAFAPAHGSLPGAAGHVLYTLRPAAARRIDEQRAALDDPAHRPSWAERATQIESGRGAIPAQIGDGPTQLLETLRAAHRRFG